MVFLLLNLKIGNFCMIATQVYYSGQESLLIKALTTLSSCEWNIKLIILRWYSLDFVFFLELEKGLSNKYVGQVELTFSNLPKSLKCKSFGMQGLILLTDISLKIQKAKFFVPHFENPVNRFFQVLFFPIVTVSQ